MESGDSLNDCTQKNEQDNWRWQRKGVVIVHWWFSGVKKKKKKKHTSNATLYTNASSSLCYTSIGKLGYMDVACVH